ncbi:putative rhizopine-binding protein [Clostridium pasteurianum DSM 525 = ATCC 6013]|uniref:Periplasmic binding protein domain containing protein n=1 Tax=Clostridium pasteurianum DSM 525 = ATCC 6013 TaxID=1262449 RepID=A0A0H3J306_CLOPA|nr:substrate-binding domain-containing protein [Clostridium pasteurianum]AJA47177.1 putative rhizopine-binding protein [Clostridium pasteurianum DSM 525 = ATCC 6013]AJA51165.1 putative rhizopine-binding protein [Clostridium pasteurianum DSM 525 = ATCC 6013]AOZ74533.1 sugar ABC transporter sugar-binding protein [Clostridium pasteurianum DSM 525 = ATCC 6013]AOZ78330.1 sugar ABC transporter sugar-binding protein [Clostridium pasteurianum]ELP59438.1 sugar ABC transporter sugar-binding protein [Clo
MKKFLLIILAIMTVCLSSGCINIGVDTAKDGNKIRIGVAIANANDKYASYLLDEMKNYSKSLKDIEVIFADAKKNSNTQLSQVENFISQRVDVIIVAPVYIDASKPITDKAKAANIPIISLMTPFENQSDAVSYIAPDSKQAATLEMEYLAKRMNYKGNVAIMMGPREDRAQRVRTETYHEVISKYPDMEIVAEQSAEWDRARGTVLMENWIESGKKIDSVAVNNDEMAIGALNTIEAAGKLGKITVGGIDATPDSLQYVKSGKLAVTVFQDAEKLSKASIDTAIKAAKGENVEKTISIKNELVTPENVDRYIAKWKNK